MNPAHERLSVHITGRVQGVFFRAFVRAEAGKRGIAGKAWNEPDGLLRIEAEGEHSKLEEFLAECRRGPAGARVDGVTASFTPAIGEFESFSITSR